MSKEEIEKAASSRYPLLTNQNPLERKMAIREYEAFVAGAEFVLQQLQSNQSGWSDEDMRNAMKASRLWSNGWLKSTSENLPEFIEEYLNQLKKM